MSGPVPIKIAFVVGEESGDILGADLLASLRNLHGAEVAAVGVGGSRMQAAGLKTLFDPHEIAVVCAWGKPPLSGRNTCRTDPYSRPCGGPRPSAGT